jgi:drug/metabolite transporter (DMT)-like permease
MRRENKGLFIMRGDFDIFLAWWGTLTLFIFFPLSGLEIFTLGFSDLIVSLLLGLLPTALAFVLYNIGLRNDTGADIVLLSYFEPVMATINTAIFFGELSFFTVLGGSLILAANFIIHWYNSRQRK